MPRRAKFAGTGSRLAALLAVLLVAAIATFGPQACYAQMTMQRTGKAVISQILPEPADSMSLDLRSPAFQSGHAIPFKFSAFGEGISPALAWQPGPEGTRSYALIVEDPDAPGPRPFVHWVIFDIPAETTELPQHVAEGSRPPEPQGAVQGSNSLGRIGYFGPRPPQGAPHHYHFQLFALDRVLSLAPGADRDAVAAAMRGHILAEDDLVGTFQNPESAGR